MYSVLSFISACVRATAARHIPVDAPVRPIWRLLSEQYFALHGEMNSTKGTKKIIAGLNCLLSTLRCLLLLQQGTMLSLQLRAGRCNPCTRLNISIA